MFADLLRELLRQPDDDEALTGRLKALGFELNPRYVRQETGSNTPVAPAGIITEPRQQSSPAKTDFDYNLAHVVKRIPKQMPNPAEALKDVDALSDEDCDTEAPYVAPPVLFDSHMLERTIASLVEHTAQSKAMDTREVCRRMAQHKNLQPLPKQTRRQSQRLDWVIVEQCDPLLADQLDLCRQLQALPALLRPRYICRLSKYDRWLDTSGNPVNAKPVPGGTALVIADARHRRRNHDIQQALRELVPQGRHHWVSPWPAEQATLWDAPAQAAQINRPVDCLLAVLAPLPVIERALLRILRQQLGARTGVEIEFCTHAHVYYSASEEWAQVFPEHRAQYRAQLQRLIEQQEPLMTRLIHTVQDFMRNREKLYFAEANLQYRQLPLQWSKTQQNEFVQQEFYLAAIAKRGEKADSAWPSSCLLNLARRLGPDIPLPEKVSNAVLLAQEQWKQRHPDQPALVGEHPERGIGGTEIDAVLCFDGQHYGIYPAEGASNRVAVQHFRCQSEGAVRDVGNGPEKVALGQAFRAKTCVVHALDADITVNTISRNRQLYWAEQVEQSAGQLNVVTADENAFSVGLDQGGEAVVDTFWPGKAQPQLDEYGLYVTEELLGVRQTFRYIPAGEFLMGSPESEAEREDDERQHKVELTQGYWLADTACTQALWQAVMGDNPSRFEGTENPVEQVSWNDIQKFLDEFNKQLPGMKLKLPTEAQWEYACRAGSETAFWWGDSLNPAQARYDYSEPYNEGPKAEEEQGTVAVKSFRRNPWGLYQMHGNVWEWCEDWYGDYSVGDVVDPEGAPDGVLRVLRGGCWFDGGRDLRSAQRFHGRPVVGDGFGYDVGFRFAHSPLPTGAKRNSQKTKPQTDTHSGLGGTTRQAVGGGLWQTLKKSLGIDKEN